MNLVKDRPSRSADRIPYQRPTVLEIKRVRQALKLKKARDDAQSLRDAGIVVRP